MKNNYITIDDLASASGEKKELMWIYSGILKRMLNIKTKGRNY